jgi:hypothetical protein
VGPRYLNAGRMKLSVVTAGLSLGFDLFGSLPVFAAGGQGALIPFGCLCLTLRSSSTVERAEGEAGRVIRDIGVEAIWLNCPQDAQHEASLGLCSEASFPSHLHLSILRASRGLKATTVGISFTAAARLSQIVPSQRIGSLQNCAEYHIPVANNVLQKHTTTITLDTSTASLVNSLARPRETFFVDLSSKGTWESPRTGRAVNYVLLNSNL